MLRFDLVLCSAVAPMWNVSYAILDGRFRVNVFIAFFRVPSSCRKSGWQTSVTIEFQNYSILLKVPIRFIMSDVRPSVYLHGTTRLSPARRYFHIYESTSLNSSYNGKYFRQICGENWNTSFILSNSCPKIAPFMRYYRKNMVEPEATNEDTIWRIRIECWISKATCTHTPWN